MQGNAKRRLKNAALFAGAPLFDSRKTGKDPYAGQQKQYFAPATQDYIWANAQYADNYFAAQVQGAIPGNFEDIRGAYIRTMDLVEQSTGSNASNDWQLVYFQDPRIHGLYTGAKLWYGGNVWIATSPRNMATATGNSVVRRCNALWHYLDYYGNVKSEPFVWAKGPANATANEYLDYSVIPNSYQKCVMQLNDATKEVALNRRMVLGTSVFDVRGVVDFVSDFSEVQGADGAETDNPEAAKTHILFFDLFEREPLAIDDMEKGVAGGKAFYWQILVSGDATMQTGASQRLRIRSLRNGEEPDAEHEVSYVFESSDTDTATVDADGTVTARGSGSVMITVTLAQNGNIAATFAIDVTEAADAPTFLFAPPLPESMRQQQTFESTVTLAGADAGSIQMTASGPPDYAYTATLTGGKLRITAWEASAVPLTITLTAGETAQTFRIALKGY